MDVSRIILWFLLTLTMACHAPRHAAGPENSELLPDDSQRILFLNYEITRDTVNSTFTARLINKVTVAGKIKSEKVPIAQAETGDLELQVLGKNQQILKTLYISNPLDKVVEFVNDRGELQKNVISLNTAEFSVRFQLEPDAATTLLKLISGPDSENTVLLKTSIQ